MVGDMDDEVKGTKPPGAAKRPPRLHSHAVAAQSNTVGRTRDHSCTGRVFTTANNNRNLRRKSSHVVNICVQLAYVE